MKKILTLAAVIGLTSYHILCAQVDVNKIIPPSPDAASLGKFAEIPVGHYTGIPSINIPVWKITNGPLNLNIGLSYHASGVKVEEIASCVGLNWSLNAGGAITRSVVGLPDDMVKPTRRGFLAYAEDLPYDIEDLPEQTPEERYLVFVQHTDGCIDTESDNYYFNFAGITGKFTFDWDHNVVIASDKKLQIVPTFDTSDPVTRITKWTVKTDDGTTYVFAARENTTQENVSEQSPLSCSGRPITYTSSWYLTQIKSSNLTDSIDLTYSDYTINHGFTESESFNHRFTSIPQYECPGTIDPAISISNSTLSTSGKRIDKIMSSNGFSVKFSNGQSRTDVQGTNLYGIGGIKIIYGSDTINHFALSYDFNGGGRLKLKSLQERGSQNSPEKPGYQFIYNSTALPPRTSKQQDYWGYYNSNTASHLVPPLAIYNMQTNEFNLISGANRDPDSVKMKAGILEKIIYPTGGTTTFNYEPHDFSYIQNDDIASLSIPILKDTTMQVVKTGDFINSWNSATLNITRKTVVTIQVGFSEPPLLGDLQDWMYPKVKITDANGLIKFQRIYQQGSVVTAIFLFPGTYTVSAYAYANDGAGRADLAVIDLSWKKPAASGLKKQKLMAGGLRIKNIIYHDGVGDTPDITDHFSYVMSGIPGKSSGVFVGETQRALSDTSYFYLVERLPCFVHEYFTVTNTALGPNDVCIYIHRFASNMSQLGSTNGSHIGYRQVTQYRTAEASGKTEYIFDSPYEYPDEIQNFLPFSPPLSFDFKRGLLKRKTSFKYTGNGIYIPVQEEHYDYSYQTTVFPMLRAALFRVYHATDTNYRYKIYPVQMGYSFPLSREVRTYNNPTSDFLTSTEQYQYSITDKQLKSVTTHDSRGKQRITNYTHPNDFVSLNNNVIDTLIKRHIYAPVLKEEHLYDGGLMDGTITEYALTGHLALPSKVLQFEPAKPNVTEVSESIFSNRNYKTRRSFITYDSKGNLTDFSEHNDVRTGFIWGYGKNYPIARVTNAASTGVFYTSFEEETTGVTNEGLTGTKSALNGLSKQITPIPEGDYILTYWKKENGEWKFKTEPQTVSGNSYTINLSGQIDEVRFYPKTAQMATYTYSPGYGMSSSNDANGEIRFYNYDGFARLRSISNTRKEIIKTFQYFYYH